jgi:hypothetical protein
MTIERIGKGAPAVAPAATDAASGAHGSQRTGQPFQVERSAPAGAPAAADTVSPALESFRSGQVDLQGYLDLKVDAATAHLTSLPKVDLDAVRAALRERLATDPALVDLVRTAAGEGSAPTEPAAGD